MQFNKAAIIFNGGLVFKTAWFRAFSEKCEAVFGQKTPCKQWIRAPI